MKTDQVGRVRTPRSRQEELLDEFERSGLSGIKFAGIVGVKYQTFAAWTKRRRKERPSSGAIPAGDKAPVSWLEAVVDRALPNNAGSVLVIQLACEARIEVANGTQAALAAQLLKHLKNDQLGAC